MTNNGLTTWEEIEYDLQQRLKPKGGKMSIDELTEKEIEEDKEIEIGFSKETESILRTLKYNTEGKYKSETKRAEVYAFFNDKLIEYGTGICVSDPHYFMKKQTAVGHAVEDTYLTFFGKTGHESLK